MRPINENESLSWPTAKLSDGEGGRIKPTELTDGGFKSLRKKSNQWFGSKLRDAVETHEEKSWPTPTLAESSGGKRTKQIKEGKWHNIQLREAIDLENEKNWPTPKSRDWKGGMGTSKERQKNDLDKIVHLPNTRQDQEKSSTSGKSQGSWGTPRQSMANSPTKKQIELGAPKKKLEDQVGKIPGRLNPNWVEQLMGLPVGWTQLPTEWID